MVDGFFSECRTNKKIHLHSKKGRNHIFTANICAHDGNNESFSLIIRKSLIVWKVEKANVLLLRGETMQPLTT